MSDEIQQAVEALKKCDQAFGIMSRSASHSGLEGTKEWDTIAGSADMYGAQDAAREAAAALHRLSGRVTVNAVEVSNLMRDAFLAGRGVDADGKCTESDLAAWANYDPPSDQLTRILAALDTAPAPGEPELSCPDIDWLLENVPMSDEAKERLETVRSICSQLCFDIWRWQANAAQESIDAALRLMQEVLPGWAVEGWTIWPGLPSRVQIVGTHEGEDGTRWHNFKDGRVQAESDTPARALLLAILEALIAKEGEG